MLAVLVVITAVVYWRYGPVCVLGEERCDGARVLVCVQSGTGRDPGRTWAEAGACGPEASCREHEARAFCVGPESGSCEASGVRCDDGVLVTCERDDVRLFELRQRCPEGTRCAEGDCVAE